MKICFENKSRDLGAEIIFEDKSILNIPPDSPRSLDISGDNATFSVKYVRDFTFGYQIAPKVDGKLTDQITNKLTEKAIARRVVTGSSEATALGNILLQEKAYV